MFTLNKTFEIITPESAEQGDVADQGFEYQDQQFESLEDLATEILSEGLVEASSSEIDASSWYTTSDPERDYRTGSDTYYSFHVDGLTDTQAQELWALIRR